MNFFFQKLNKRPMGHITPLSNESHNKIRFVKSIMDEGEINVFWLLT